MPIELEAVVRSEGGGELECTVRDFCVGGLYLVVRNLDTEYVVLDRKQLVAGDRLRVQFTVKLDGPSRAYEVDATVAGVLGGGFGVEFVDPDSQAVHELQQLALRQQTDAGRSAGGGPDPTATGSIAEAVKSAEVLAQCRQCFEQFLGTGSDAVFKHASEALFKAAGDARSNAEQNELFDLIKDVERLKPPIEKEFIETLLHQFDHLGEPLAERDTPTQEGGLGGLSLVDTLNFDDWLTVKNILTRWEHRYREASYQALRRLSQLSGAEVDEADNPLGLNAVCISFHDAIQNLGADRVARRRLFEGFEAAVVESLGEFLERLNDIFLKHGVTATFDRPVPVLPKGEAPPEAEPSESEPTPAPAEAAAAPAPASAAAPPVAAPAAVPHPGPPAAPAETVARADPTSFIASPASADAGSSAGTPVWDPNAPVGRGGESPLEAYAGDSAAPSAPDFGPGFSDPVDDPFATVGQTDAAQAPVARPPPAGESALPALEGDAAAEIAPAPPVRHAYRTARRLMGLRRPPAAPASVPGGGPAPTTEQIATAMSRLAPADAETSRADATLGLSARVRAAAQSEGLALDEAQSDSVDVISSLLDCIIDDPLVNESVKSRIKRLALPLLQVALDDESFFEDEAHPARQVVNRLSQLELPPGSAGGDRNTMQGGVDPLIEQILSAGGGSEAFSTAVSELDALLGEQHRVYDANVRQVVESAADQHERELRRGLAPAPPASLSADLEPWVAQASKLTVGDQILFATRSGGARRVSVAWRGDEQGPIAFVDPNGNNAGTLPVEQFAKQLMSGSAWQAESPDLPAMDRGWFSMLDDIHRDLAYQATHDPLTELPNQKAFEARVHQALANSKREGREHVVCLLELDQLSSIHEQCGRAASDNLIKKLAAVLKKHVADKGLVARLRNGGLDNLGGFAVLLERAGLEDGRQFAERQRYAIEQSRVVWKGRSFDLSVSVGLVVVNPESESALALLEAATAACARAHEDGGNRIEGAGDGAAAGPPAAASSTAAVTSNRAGSVRGLLDSGRCVLMRQRIAPIALDDDSKPHFEVLLALKDEQGNLVGPGEFLQAAEREEQMLEVDRWVVKTALGWLGENRGALLESGGYGINLAGGTLSEPSFIEYVVEQLNETTVPPGKILFEVTETAAISALSVAVDFIRTLQEYGCRFCLDDFGTGYASFSYLKSLPLDYVKIDGMFVKDIVDSPSDLAVVRSINEIGHFLGKRTVAEYVETEAILEQLREVGVDYAQGYAIEKPTLLA